MQALLQETFEYQPSPFKMGYPFPSSQMLHPHPAQLIEKKYNTTHEDQILHFVPITTAHQLILLDIANLRNIQVCFYY
jgi:hypothetical protein